MTDSASTRQFVTKMAKHNPGIRYDDMCAASRFLDKDVNRVLDAMIAEGSLLMYGHEHRLTAAPVPRKPRRSR